MQAPGTQRSLALGCHDHGANVKHALMLFFGIVIFAGESYKILGINLAGLSLLIVLWRLRHNLNQLLEYLWLVAPFVVFLTLGLLKYRFGDVVEDSVPFITFLIVSAALALLTPRNRSSICKFIVICSALAVLKVLAINYFDITPEWAGNTFWQGTKDAMESGFNRITLKGADVFIGTSTIVLLYNLTLRPGIPRLFKSWTTTLLLVALTISIVFSLTRGTIVAIAASLVVWMLTGIKSGLQRSTGPIVISLLLAAVMLTGPFTSGASVYYERFADTVGLGGHAAEDDVAYAYRYVETANAFQAAQEVNFLGAGLGSSYWTPLSGSAKDDGISLFAHSLPVWLLLKLGVVGVCAFYCALLLRIGALLKRVLFRRVGNPAALHFVLTSTAGLLFLLFNDLINNKFATLSGASAYALYFVLGKDRAQAHERLEDAR